MGRASKKSFDYFNNLVLLQRQLEDLTQECDALKAENAALVDRHNRESHNTASHEAMAYDALDQELTRAMLDRVELMKERDALKAENERLRKELDGKDKLLDEVRDTLTNYGYDMGEVERLRNSNSRLRKAVNWMRGCFDPETWEYKRATAVLEEEKCCVTSNYRGQDYPHLEPGCCGRPTEELAWSVSNEKATEEEK